MILSAEQIKVLKENKNLITSEILDELRKTKEGKSVALEILDIEKDSEDYYLDAFGGRIAFNGNRQIKPFHTKINLSDIHIQEIKKCSEDIDYFKNNYVQFRTKSGIGFPDHREYQEKFIHSLNDENDQYLVIFKPRCLICNYGIAGRMRLVESVGGKTDHIVIDAVCCFTYSEELPSPDIIFIFPPSIINSCSD